MPPRARDSAYLEAERGLRDWMDELLVAADGFDPSQPPPTDEERWQRAVKDFGQAFAEAGAAGALEGVARLLGEAGKSFEAVAKARRPGALEHRQEIIPDLLDLVDETELDRPYLLALALQHWTAELSEITQLIERHIRFDRFGRQEGERRRCLAKVLRARAISDMGRRGGSYLQARQRILTDLARTRTTVRPSPRPRPRDRRQRATRRARAPTSSSGSESSEPPGSPERGDPFTALLRGGLL